VHRPIGRIVSKIQNIMRRKRRIILYSAIAEKTKKRKWVSTLHVSRHIHCSIKQKVEHSYLSIFSKSVASASEYDAMK